MDNSRISDPEKKSYGKKQSTNLISLFIHKKSDPKIALSIHSEEEIKIPALR